MLLGLAKSFEEPIFRVPRPDVVTVTKQMFSQIGQSIDTELDSLVKSIVPSMTAGALLMDKPAITLYPEVLANKDAQYMSSARGIEHLERLSLNPSNTNITADQFGIYDDEMKISTLLAKKVFLVSLVWTSTNSPGDILWKTPISPTHFLKGEAIPVGTVFDPTLIGVMANMFTYWRGGFVLTFQIVGTPFHEGRLDMCYHPGELEPPTTASAAVTQYFKSQTIRNVNNVLEVEIPFLSDTPWKYCWDGRTLSETNVGAGDRFLDFITGCFSLRVGATLKAPESVAQQVAINVFVSGASDLEFHTMSLSGGWMKALDDIPAVVTKDKSNDWVNIKPSKRVSVVKQVGDLNDKQTTQKDNLIVLAAGTGTTMDVSPAHFGEKYTSIRECLKRYSKCYCAERTPNAEGVTIDQPNTQFGAVHYWSLFFRGMRGPLNYKYEVITNTADSYQGFITHGVKRTTTPADVSQLTAIMTALDIPEIKPTMPALVRFSNTQVAEFQIPFYQINHYAVNKAYGDNISTYYNSLEQAESLIALYTYGASTRTALYVAFGDETRFGVFRGTPPHKFMTQTWPNNATLEALALIGV